MQILLHKKFQKRYAKLPQKIENPLDPTLNNHSVGPAYPDSRSINIAGNYRAIFQEKGDGVIFINIRTHPQLYGK